MMQQQFDILGCLADPVLVIDSGYIIVYANQAMVELCDLELDNIIGSKCYQLSHQCLHPCTEAELGRHPCNYAHVFTKGTSLHQKHRHMLPGGTVRIFDMTSSPLRDANNKITHVIQVLRDITRQEELQALAEERQHELERLFTLAPFYIATIDTDMRVRWINPPTEKLTGFQSRAIRGRHCYDLWGQYAGDPQRKGAERICDGCTAPQSMKDGKTHAHNRHVDDRTFEIITVPLTSPDGEVTGAIEFGFDITAHKKTEEELKKNENRLRILFENSPTPLCVADFSGIVRCFDSLRQKGVNDVPTYLADHKKEMNKYLGYIKILDVNQASLALVGLPSKEALFANIDSLLKKIPLHENPEGLFAIARGKKKRQS